MMITYQARVTVLRSRLTLVLPLLATFVLVDSTRLIAEESNVPPEGFVVLFNGDDFEGWCGQTTSDPVVYRNLPAEERAKKEVADKASFEKHWRVEDGQIINDGHGVFCTTVKDYEDFELLIDWKMVAPFTDSGIYLRGCPQVQIWDPNSPAQQKHGCHLGSGGLWNNNPGSPGKDPLVKSDNPVGEWNTLRIRIVGDIVTIHQNDQLIVDEAQMHNYWNRDNPLYDKGPIQLQTHGGEMRFRNIFLREIDVSE